MNSFETMHKNHIDSVQRLLEELSLRVDEQEQQQQDQDDATWRWLPNHQGAISILGDRGTGKTTLLYDVARKLKKDDDKFLVLQRSPISPLDFLETRSLFSYVLTVSANSSPGFPALAE